MFVAWFIVNIYHCSVKKFKYTAYGGIERYFLGGGFNISEEVVFKDNIEKGQSVMANNNYVLHNKQKIIVSV